MRRSLSVIAITGVMSGTLIAAGATGATAAGASARPAAEHVSSAVHRVTLRYNQESTTPTSSSGSGDGTTERGARAARLVKLFNALKREPKGYLHCEIAGGPQTVVTFHGPHHTWVATQQACTDVVVTRDGKRLPTLLPSKAWAKEVNSDLGR